MQDGTGGPRAVPSIGQPFVLSLSKETVDLLRTGVAALAPVSMGKGW